MAALVHLFDATEAPCRAHEHTLTRRMRYQLSKGATETLVVRARALNYFHISGVLRPSDLVGESCLGLGATIWGIEHVGLPCRGKFFCARASMIIRIFVLGGF